jgi:hypothetical protein
VHFPIALWMTATLAILWRVVSDGPLAQAIDRALVPLLTIGLVFGVAAYVVGLMVWPWETISSTPLGRNHMLLATWTVAYWALLLATRWLQGEAVWNGIMRWVMGGLAILGSVLLGITGLGWEVYTTFYVPTVTLVALAVAALLLAGIGLWGRTVRGAG